jgi:RimJ/RimL family protein N-acetyltransferase
VQTWWQARCTDPDCTIAFADTAPQNFPDLLRRIATGDYLFYLARDHAGQVIGAMWLHDIVRDANDTPRAGWLGTYVLPEHRGIRTTQTMWAQVREALERRGVRSVYIASHHANTRAHRVAEHHLGFHKVDLFPAFTCFAGLPTDCLILSMRREDTTEAWAIAHARARQQGIIPRFTGEEHYVRVLHA